MNEININEIVKIESMAVIKSQLDEVEKLIDEKVKDIPKILKKIKEMSFNEQEDEKNDIKKYQQYLSNLQKQLEDKRKEIKKEINKPYEEFNEYYNNGVYTKLDGGIQQLKEVINEIEGLQKDEKKCELELFAKEYIKVNNLENIMSFDDIPLNITLSASMKSLKEEAKRFIEDVANDIDLIRLEEYGDEILLEYKKTFDFTKSKLDVLTRKKQLEEIKKQQEERQLQFDEEEKIVEKVEEITMPKEVIENEDVITVTFKITDTKENIIKVREYMKKEGIKYE